MVDALRIVFMGTPAFAVPTLGGLLAARHTVVGVVTQPDKPRGRGQKVSDAPVKTLALERGLPIIQPARLREPDVEAALRAWRPDLGARLLVSVVDRIAEGTATEEPQDDSQASFAPRLTKDEGLVDWSLPARAIHDRVRGLHPWPHAYTFIDGERTIILRSRVEGGDAAR